MNMLFIYILFHFRFINKAILSFIQMVEIEKLENSGALTVLITIYNLKKTYQDELRRESKIGINTLKSRLVELQSVGLIKEETEDKFGGKHYLWLTPKGKRIAEKLVEIEEILKEK